MIFLIASVESFDCHSIHTLNVVNYQATRTPHRLGYVKGENSRRNEGSCQCDLREGHMTARRQISMFGEKECGKSRMQHTTKK